MGCTFLPVKEKTSFSEIYLSMIAILNGEPSLRNIVKLELSEVYICEMIAQAI